MVYEWPSKVTRKHDFKESFRTKKGKFGAWFVRGRFLIYIFRGFLIFSLSFFPLNLLIFPCIFLCHRVSQGLQVGGPIFHFDHVELWNQGKM